MIRAWTRRILWSLTAAALLAVSGGPAFAAAPLAGQHYPNGAADIFGGILPPQPGFYMINYLALIQKDRLMDDDGKKLSIPGLGTPKFKVDATVEVPRFIWVSPYKILGAKYGAQVFIPTYNARIDSPVVGVGGEQEDRGLGDIIFSPFILGFHFSPNLHMVFAEDIWAPTGDYDEANFATQILSKNNWTFETVLAVTYLFQGLDLSAKFMYDFNTKNDKYDPDLAGPSGTVDLNPGQEFHVDYAIDYGTSMNFRYGVSGYYYQQVTEDEVDGDKVDGKSRFAAIGPTFKYWPDMGKWQFTLKHLWEFGAKNAPEGQNTWLNATYAF